MSLPQFFTASLETALNHYLSLDPEIMDRFGDLEGRVIAIEILGLNETLYLFPASDGFMVMSEFDGIADTTLSGTPLALARLGISHDASAALFAGEVIISGDTRLGHQFKKILSQLDIDWEEQLSKLMGDVAAHQIGNAARDFSTWFKRSCSSLTMDLGEYVQEEARLVATRPEVERFVKDVDELRDAVERLEARIKQLTK
ncbi:MAG: sterol-binding protein [Gammaproteobacteria bacterium]|nr:MAG: sterol-binding protein [Gammaproteobacteria bacterium]